MFNHNVFHVTHPLLFQNITVKINGGIKVDIHDYNFVYYMLHDYAQGVDASKLRQTGGENSDPSNELYITAKDAVERRGYSIAPFDLAVVLLIFWHGIEVNIVLEVG